jgi:uncharacterized integral membrane protein (TIGR00697 family)
MNNTYRIVSVDDSYRDTGRVQVKVQVVGKAQTFDKPVSELYHKEWLENFSKEDVAHIAALYTAEHTQNLALIESFSKAIPAAKSGVMIVGILFTAFLILSNLTAFKLASIGSINFPAGLIFFPLTYIFDDILTEVYGFKTSRRIIWMALVANTIVFLGTWCTIYLTPSPFWHEQEAYAIVYHATLRVFIASMLSYFFGEFANSIILAKLKIISEGKHLWLRVMMSTIVGVGVDTILFIHIAFLFVLPYVALCKVISTIYILKVLYEICALPITCKLSSYLKRKDNVDYYDFKTKFNPFSLAV